MLKGIPPLLSPDLLATLARMGHGDELVIADANFPGEGLGPKTIRADGLSIPPLLDAILSLIELDYAVSTPLFMMSGPDMGENDELLEQNYISIAARHSVHGARVERVERQAFYEQARNAFAILITGDTARRANIIVKKGVIKPV